MEPNLANYKQWLPREYISGSYFNRVFAKEPGLIQKPLILRVEGSSVSVRNSDISFKRDPQIPVHLLRVIIEVIANGKVGSRHSNVIIIDNQKKDIIRFEPLSGLEGSAVNEAIVKVLGPVFHNYRYYESVAHPQRLDSSRGLCVAYSIYFAYFYLLQEPIVFEGEYNMHRFAMAIKHIYGEINDSDVEYGPGGGFGVGLLGGLALGSLIALPLAAAASQPRYVYL